MIVVPNMARLTDNEDIFELVLWNLVMQFAVVGFSPDQTRNFLWLKFKRFRWLRRHRVDNEGESAQ